MKEETTSRIVNTGMRGNNYNDGMRTKEKMITPELIGANIRRLRLAHGETQQVLGDLLGYGATTIANYESGYRMPDLEAFFQIAQHYEANLDDFLWENDTNREYKEKSESL